eukprot:5305370-Amphidinium_carterae.1
MSQWCELEAVHEEHSHAPELPSSDILRHQGERSHGPRSSRPQHVEGTRLAEWCWQNPAQACHCYGDVNVDGYGDITPSFKSGNNLKFSLALTPLRYCEVTHVIDDDRLSRHSSMCRTGVCVRHLENGAV